MTKIHMISTTINLAALRETMARQGISNDEGLALHHFLSETFGKGMIQPFRMMPGRKNAPTASLYGYSVQSKDELKETSDICAFPEMNEILGLDVMKSKIMPTIFNPGKRLGFDVRIKPMRRLASSIVTESREVRHGKPKGKSTKTFPAGSEVDAFLLERMRLNPKSDDTMTTEFPSREQVYLTWLAHRFRNAGDIESKICRMARYKNESISRGSKKLAGPDVTIHGEFIVKDSERLNDLIARGIGRHMAYGYGMLLLRPSRH